MLPGHRLPLLSAKPMTTCPATGHYYPQATTKSYHTVTTDTGVNNLIKVTAVPVSESNALNLSHKSDTLQMASLRHLVRVLAVISKVW